MNQAHENLDDAKHPRCDESFEQWLAQTGHDTAKFAPSEEELARQAVPY